MKQPPVCKVLILEAENQRSSRLQVIVGATFTKMFSIGINYFFHNLKKKAVGLLDCKAVRIFR